jgi:hypothetical protein
MAVRQSLFACGSDCNICVYFRNEFMAVSLHKCAHRSMLSYGKRNLSRVCRNVICMAMSWMQILCQEQGLISMIWSYCVGIRTRIFQRILLSLLSETNFFCSSQTGSGVHPATWSVCQGQVPGGKVVRIHLNTRHFPLAIEWYLIKHRDTFTCTFQEVVYVRIYGLFNDISVALTRIV